MSWFKSRKADASSREIAPQRSTRDLDKQKITWVKTTSMGNIMELFTEFTEDIKSAYTKSRNKTIVSNQNSHKAFLEQMEGIRQLWFKINRNYISDMDAITMFDLVNVTIPLIIQSYQSISAEWGPYYAVTYRGDCKEKLEVVYKRLSNVNVNQNQAKALAVTQEVTEEQELDQTFPTYKGISQPEITKALIALEILWLQASHKNTSIEDEFFVEQVVASYVPDALNMYKSFQFAPEASKTKALALLLEQFKLIETHLTRIVNTQMEQSLSAMKSHTEFLRVKTEEAKDSEPLKIKGKRVGKGELTA
jgi:hypothetical protein